MAMMEIHRHNDHRGWRRVTMTTADAQTRRPCRHWCAHTHGDGRNDDNDTYHGDGESDGGNDDNDALTTYSDGDGDNDTHDDNDDGGGGGNSNNSNNSNNSTDTRSITHNDVS